MFGIFPLLALVVIAFNVVVFASGAFSGSEDAAQAGDAQGGDQLSFADKVFSQEVFSVSMISGDRFSLTVGGIFLIVSLLVLFIEILKSTRSDQTSSLNHAFSLIVFVVCLIEFLVLRGFANQYFLLIMLMTLIDVVAGYTVTISSARRDLGVSTQGGASIF